MGSVPAVLYAKEVISHIIVLALRLRRTWAFLLKARCHIVSFAIAEKGPASDKPSACGKHNKSEQKFQPIKIGSDGFISEIGEINKDGIFHFEKTKASEQTGNYKHEDCDKTGSN